MQWTGPVVWKAGGPTTLDYMEFVRQFWLVFYHPVHGLTSGQRLIHLSQGDTSVAQYAIFLFRVIAAESGWNLPTLQATFLNGLHPDI